MDLAVIFDLDGTLVDSAPDIHAAVNHMMAQYNQPLMDLTTLTGHLGAGVEIMLKNITQSTGWKLSPSDFANACSHYRNYYDQHPADHTIIYPSVTQQLQQLRAMDIALGICTNKPQELARLVLQRLNLDQFFDAIVGRDTTDKQKPDPKPLLHCQQLIGKAQTIFVGDSEFDAEAAKAAFTPFILYSGGYHHGAITDIPRTMLIDHHDMLVRSTLMIARELGVELPPEDAQTTGIA